MHEQKKFLKTSGKKAVDAYQSGKGYKAISKALGQ